MQTANAPYLPSAFSFSSRSLSSGHLLERHVWARSPIPQGAEACYSSTFANSKYFSKNYSTPIPSSSCISSCPIRNSQVPNWTARSIGAADASAQAQRTPNETVEQENQPIHTHALDVLNSRENGSLYVHMKMEDK